MDGSVKADIAMQVQRVEVLPADASGVTFAQGAIMIFVRPNTRHGCPGKTAMQQMLEISFFAEVPCSTCHGGSSLPSTSHSDIDIFLAGFRSAA